MIDAKTKFQQSRYFLRNLCMNNAQPKSVKIIITTEPQFVNTNGSFFQIKSYVAKRGHYVGIGPTPALARYRLREKEGAGR